MLGSLVKAGCVVFVAAIWRGWTPWLLLLCGAGYAMAAVSNYLGLL
jgi:2-polyprenyl-3-methyl-5-hydroxy-6-metoxy-1,4-benzoquinol methylase